jgi:hypothetical protein
MARAFLRLGFYPMIEQKKTHLFLNAGFKQKSHFTGFMHKPRLTPSSAPFF